jgi:zinc transporter ZupT
VCILGYTAILIVQRVIPIANLHSHSELGHGHSHGHQHHSEVEGAPRNKEAALVVDGGSNPPAHSTERDSAAGSRPPSRPPFRSSSRRSASANGAAGSSPNLEDTPLISHSGADDQEQYHHADQHPQEGSRHSNMRQSSLKIVALVSEGEVPTTDSNGEPSSHYDQEHATQSKIRSYALLLALLLHNFASGLALGVQNNTKDVMTVFIALVAHKWAEGLTLGVSIAKAPTLKSKNKRLLLLFIFALGCPIGIAIGWAAEAALPASASGFLMALSAGTFLYIGASEVVAEEFATTDKGALKIFFFLLGCVCIFLTTAFAHSHGEHEGEGAE